MDKTDFNVRGPGAFVICFDKGGATRLSGRMYHPYSAEQINFSSPDVIFNIMERVFDHIGFPQASTQIRSFRQNEKSEDCDRAEAEKLMQKDILNVQKGNKGTFIVHVKSRQNATWQGKITWAEKDLSRNFRSVLELLKLIDSAIDEEAENED